MVLEVVGLPTVVGMTTEDGTEDTTGGVIVGMAEDTTGEEIVGEAEDITGEESVGGP